MCSDSQHWWLHSYEIWGVLKAYHWRTTQRSVQRYQFGGSGYWRRWCRSSMNLHDFHMDGVNLLWTRSIWVLMDLICHELQSSTRFAIFQEEKSAEKCRLVLWPHIQHVPVYSLDMLGVCVWRLPIYLFRKTSLFTRNTNCVGLWVSYIDLRIQRILMKNLYCKLHRTNWLRFIFSQWYSYLYMFQIDMQ